jgi:hypothetical protein
MHEFPVDLPRSYCSFAPLAGAVYRANAFGEAPKKLSLRIAGAEDKIDDPIGRQVRHCNTSDRKQPNGLDRLAQPSFDRFEPVLSKRSAAVSVTGCAMEAVLLLRVMA